MSLTIKVNWRDIQRANSDDDIRNDGAKCCPISRAVNRMFSDDDAAYTLLNGELFIFDKKYKLPIAAQYFIDEYDLGRHPGPITFVAEEA